MSLLGRLMWLLPLFIVLIVVALLTCAKVASAATVLSPGAKEKVQFSGNIYGNVYISIEQEAYEAGWRLRILNKWDATQCSGNGVTYTCANLGGDLFAEITAPIKPCSKANAREAELKFSNRPNSHFVVEVESNFYCTADEIIKAYWYNEVGECAADAYTVSNDRYTPPEAKHVCGATQ